MTMRLRTPLNAVWAVAAASLVIGPNAAEARARRPATSPVVVELYTAQGCSACPQANRVIGDLAANPGVLPLTFSVDYWDYLGWADTLAKPEFTARQRAFADRLKVREIYTPEIVVNGKSEGPALDKGKLDDMIADAQEHRLHSPQVHFIKDGARVAVGGSASDGHADVWLVRYDPQPAAMKIKTGENKGQIVTVRNAVREVTRLGGWWGSTKTFAMPSGEDDGLKRAVIVQLPNGGRILAAIVG